MKKLLLLSLTLGLTFPASHLFAGGLLSKQAKTVQNPADKPENNNNAVQEHEKSPTDLPDDVVREIFDHLLEEHLNGDRNDHISLVPFISDKFGRALRGDAIKCILEKHKQSLNNLSLTELAKLHYKGIPKILQNRLKELLQNNDDAYVIQYFLFEPLLNHKTEPVLVKAVEEYNKQHEKYALPAGWVKNLSAKRLLMLGKVELATKVLGTRHHEALGKLLKGLFIAAPVSAVISVAGNWYLDNPFLTPILHWFF